MPKFPFNVRVYGLYIKYEEQKLLVTDEIRQDRMLTKFPGGGLQFEEGLRTALKREWQEETGQPISTGDHFYTTDFFQRSLFNNNTQVISVYYFVHSTSSFPLPVKTTPFSFDHKKEGAQIFRWLPFSALQPEHFTLPIEKHVARLLIPYLKEKR